MFAFSGEFRRSFLVIFSLAALIITPIACGGGGGGGDDGGDITVPNVLSTLPDNGDSGVSNDTDVIINFSEAMDQASVQAGLSVADYAGAKAFNWTVGDARTTLSFNPALAVDTTYTVTLDAGVLDAEGTSLGAAYIFSFTTGSVPTASINSPNDLATGVSLSPTINITFSEDMDNGSVMDNFGVTGYAGTLNYNWVTITDLDITFDPDLAADTTYTASLLFLAEDAEGTRLGVSHQVTFSTGSTIATGAISGVIDDDPDSSYDDSLEKTTIALFDHDFTNTNGPPPITFNADAAGAYHFSFLEDGNYWVLALQDTNGDGELAGDKFVETGDSAGVWSDFSTKTIEAVTITGGGQSTSISFTMVDTEGISGEVTYAGTNTADAYSTGSVLFVGAFTDPALSGEPLYGTDSRTDDEEDFDVDTNIWSYAINSFFGSPSERMASDDYYVAGFIDLDGDNYDTDIDGDGDFDDGEPAGVFHSTVPIWQTGQDAIDIDFTAYDTVMLFGQVDSLTDTTDLTGVPYQGATVTLMDYPLEATTDSSGAFTMRYSPVGVNVAVHFEPTGGSSLWPYNTQYRDISTDDAYKPVSNSDFDGIEASLLATDVIDLFASLCSVTLNTNRAQIVGNYTVIDGEVLFADGTVKYIDSQQNCSPTENQDVQDGPSFFVFNVDESLFTGNKGDISGSSGGGIGVTVTIPVRNGEITWVDLID